MYKILLIEDDVNLGMPLTGALEMQGYKVQHLTNGNKAFETFLQYKPDIVILDVILNGVLDGFEIGKQIRMENNTPILFTTSLDGNNDIKSSFSLGNSDYTRKPYKLMEVLLRIKNLLTGPRMNIYNNNTFQLGSFCFSPDEQSLKFETGKIHLNNYESAVLALLCDNMEGYVRKSKIIDLVWHEKQPKLKEGSLNNVLTNLRKKLNKDGGICLDTKISLGVRLSIIEN